MKEMIQRELLHPRSPLVGGKVKLSLNRHTFFSHQKNARVFTFQAAFTIDCLENARCIFFDIAQTDYSERCQQKAPKKGPLVAQTDFNLPHVAPSFDLSSLRGDKQTGE